MAAQAPPELIGIHTNMAGCRSTRDRHAALGRQCRLPAGLSADEKLACDLLAFVVQERSLRALHGVAPANAVRNRGFTGRPGRLDDRSRRAQLRDDRAVHRRPAGKPDARRRPRQLHALLADEHGCLFRSPLPGNTFNYFTPKGVNIPVAVSVFPDELYQPPRSWAEKAYPKLIHFNKARQGRSLCRLGTAADSLRKNCAPASDRCADSWSQSTSSQMAIRRG